MMGNFIENSNKVELRINHVRINRARPVVTILEMKGGGQRNEQ